MKAIMKSKLFLVTHGFPWGTGEKTFIIPELPYLKEKYDLTIISCASDKIYNQNQWCTEIEDDIDLIRYPNNPLSFFEKVIYTLRACFSILFLKEFIKVLKDKKNYSVRIIETLGFYINSFKFFRWLCSQNIISSEKSIYYSYWSSYEHLAGLMFKKKNPEVKVVSRLHGADLYNERYRGGRQPFKEYLNKYSDLLVFIASIGREYFINHFSSQCALPKHCVCKLGIEGYKCNSKHGSKIFHLLSCSNAISLKRIDLIIKALSRIEDIQINWTHFGDGELLVRLKEMANNELPSNIRFEFKGQVSSDEIRRFYLSEYIDCFITTSSSEGCPVSIMEALSASIPIIGTAVGDIPSMINENGILLSGEPTIQEIEQAIRSMACLDHSKIDKMREKSFEIWNRDYNIEKNARCFLSLLERLK